MARHDDTTFELLGAYLDGELAGDERAEVEALLAVSAPHREWLEELRAMQEEFATAPRMKPPADLQSRIMASVEQTTPPWLQTGMGPAPASRSSVPASARGPKRALMYWAVAAACVTLLLGWAYLTYQREPGAPDVAQDPRTPDANNIAQQDVSPPQEDPQLPDAPRPDDPVPPIDPESFLVSKVKFDNAEADLMLIVEYSVKAKVFRSRTFENTLKMHGVTVEDQLLPDEKAQEALLKCHTFSKEKAEQPDGGDIQVSIVVAELDTIFQVIQNFNRVEGVDGSRYGLSIEASDQQMLGELARIRDRQIEQRKSADDEPRAYFVAFRDDFRNMALGQTSSLLKLESLQPDANAELGPAGVPGSVMPVVFVIRSGPVR